MNEPDLKVRWIDPRSAPDNFPAADHALSEPNGLLAIGGDLSVDRLMNAYGRGIFPWYSEDQPILWWSPDPRAVIFPDEFRMSRSLKKIIRKNHFAISIDESFAEVISGCANRGEESGTWLTAEMIDAYEYLHAAGHAHSVDVWHDGKLAGGLYGVSLGQIFFAESMFYNESNASKVALAGLVAFCRESGIGLIDCQMASMHLARHGSREISRAEFLRLLEKFKSFPAPRSWKKPLTGTAAAIP